MPKRVKAIIGAIGFGVITMMVVVNLQKARGDIIEVQTEKVTRGDVTQLVTASGKIQPKKKVNISAHVSAEISRLHVKEGDKVAAGQLLIELDHTRYQAALERAKSDLKSAKAKYKKAGSELKRARQLFEMALFSKADIEGAEANYELAQSGVEQAEANLKQATDDLTKTRLVSPIAGTVAKLNKEEGEIALGSQFQADIVMMVADLTRMEMVAEVDENDVVLVSLGDSAEIEIDALSEQTFFGYVSEIAHTATIRGRGTREEITNFEVKIMLTGEAKKLRPGMSATVRIFTETRRNVDHVPIQAITTRQPLDITGSPAKLYHATWRSGQVASSSAGQVLHAASKTNGSVNHRLNHVDEKKKQIEVVFAVEGKRAFMMPIETGITGEKNVEIMSGLTEGQEIVTGSFRALASSLKNGSRVKVNNKLKNYKNLN